MSVIRWEAPPERQKGQWQCVAEDLKERPGEWALVAEGLLSDTAYGSVGRALTGYTCEVKVRKISGQGWSVWARYPTG